MRTLNRTLTMAAALAASAQVLAQDKPQSAEGAAVPAADRTVPVMAQPRVLVSARGNDFSRDPQLVGFDRKLITQVDYPPEAYLAGSEGRAHYTLEVDATGQVTGCTIRERSGHVLLDEATCSLMLKRAKFEPARDDEGEPVSGFYSDSHNWRIRKPDIEPSFSISVAYTIDENGQQSDCEIIRAEGNLPDDFRERPCPRSGRRNQPVFRDEQGRPIRKRVLLTLEATEVDEAPEAE